MVNYTNSLGANNFAVVRTITSILVMNFPEVKKYYSYGAIAESCGAFNETPLYNKVKTKFQEFNFKNKLINTCLILKCF